MESVERIADTTHDHLVSFLLCGVSRHSFREHLLFLRTIFMRGAYYDMFISGLSLRMNPLILCNRIWSYSGGPEVFGQSFHSVGSWHYASVGNWI